MPDADSDLPKHKVYPTITLADIDLVKTVLDQIKEGGSGAQARTANMLNINSSMITLRMHDIEAVLGHDLVKKGEKSRRRPILTYVGEEFRHNIGHILGAWDKIVRQVEDAAEMDRRWSEEAEREIDERDR